MHTGTHPGKRQNLLQGGGDLRPTHTVPSVREVDVGENNSSEFTADMCLGVGCVPRSAARWGQEQPGAGGGSSPLSSVCTNSSWWTIKIMGDPEKKSLRQMEEI